MIVIEGGSGGGSSAPIVVVSGTDGVGSDTSVTTGNHSGKSAKIISEHGTITKYGPVFVVYDPLLSALLGINF